MLSFAHRQSSCCQHQLTSLDIVDMPDYVCHRSHAGQNIHCHIVPACLPHSHVSKDHVRSQRRHRGCMDLQHTGHHFPMQPRTRCLGLFFDTHLFADRQVLLLYHCLFHLHRLSSLHLAVARLLETQTPTQAKVHCVSPLRRWSVRHRGISSPNLRPSGGERSRCHNGIGVHHQMVCGGNWYRHRLRLHSMPETPFQEVLGREELERKVRWRPIRHHRTLHTKDYF